MATGSTDCIETPRPARLRKASSLGVVPSMRRKVRIRCAASEKPAFCAAAVFVIVALASIYPTVQFASWRKAMKLGSMPAVAPGKLRAIRRVIHWELAGVVVILACAALMARGVGYFGG